MKQLGLDSRAEFEAWKIQESKLDLPFNRGERVDPDRCKELLDIQPPKEYPCVVVWRWEEPTENYGNEYLDLIFVYKFS